MFSFCPKGIIYRSLNMTFQPSQSSVDYLGREIKLTLGVAVSTVFGALVSD